MSNFYVYYLSPHRLYPIDPETAVVSGSSGSSSGSSAPEFLAISHSGVRLARRQKGLPTDYLEVGT